MSNDDRNSGGAEGAYRNDEGQIMTGWTEEDLAHVAADELRAALTAHGARTREVAASGLDVDVAFGDLRDAETMLALSLDGSGGPGSLHDRATSGCLTVTALDPETVMDDAEMAHAIEEAFRLGWQWIIHPDLSGRRVGWHVSVTMSHADANSVTAALNALRNLGGAA